MEFYLCRMAIVPGSVAKIELLSHVSGWSWCHGSLVTLGWWLKPTPPTHSCWSGWLPGIPSLNVQWTKRCTTKVSIKIPSHSLSGTPKGLLGNKRKWSEKWTSIVLVWPIPDIPKPSGNWTLSPELRVKKTRKTAHRVIEELAQTLAGQDSLRGKKTH